MGVLGGGQKVYVEKVYVLFPPLVFVFFACDFQEKGAKSFVQLIIHYNNFRWYWYANFPSLKFEKNRSRPSGLNIPGDRSWIEFFDGNFFCTPGGAPKMETPGLRIDWD